MEYFVRESDGYPVQSLNEKVMRYQVWTVDLFFMALDGILGTDDFEIWVSRVNPYGEARDQNASNWQRQLRNYDTEYMPEVKAIVLRWLDKAYRRQAQTEPRSDKVLFTYSSHSTLRKEDFPVMNFVRDFSELYNRTDIVAQSSKEPYLKSITEDYDGVFFMGHCSAKFIDNGASTNDFDNPFSVNARFFHFNACNTMRTVAEDGLSYDRSFAYDHVFRTLNGGVAAIGYTKNSGGYQDDEAFYKQMGTDIVGDALLKWANHRTLVFDNSRYPQEVYDWFYAVSLIGDPFIKIEVKHEKAKMDSVPHNVALHATRYMDISGVCNDLTQGSSGRCTIVNDNEKDEKGFSTYVSAEAEVGSIYVRDGFSLENRARIKNMFVYDTYPSALLFVQDSVQYDAISYIAPQSWNAKTDESDMLKDFSVFNCPNLTVDSVYTLTDGVGINKLTVNPKGLIVFPAGVFHVGSVDLGEGSGYRFENNGKPSILHVGNFFRWQGEFDGFDYEGAAKNFKVVLHNVEKVLFFNQFFVGSIYAPGTQIEFAEESKSYGSFYAKDISLHQNAVICYVPLNPAADSLEKREDPRTVIPEVKNPAGVKILALDRNSIGFHAAKNGFCRVVLMDINGRKVASFEVDAHAGTNVVHWSSEKVARGHYLVKVRQGSVSESKFLMLD